MKVRVEAYLVLVTNYLRQFDQSLKRFLCPHCTVGEAAFESEPDDCELGPRWHCSRCPASGYAESLAITLGIDPEVPENIEPRELPTPGDQHRTRLCALVRNERSDAVSVDGDWTAGTRTSSGKFIATPSGRTGDKP